MDELKLFTVDGEQYAFTPDLKRKIIDETETERTVDVWFEGETLHHTYTEDVNGCVQTRTETTDVVTTFETYAGGQETLANYGCYPVSGVDPADLFVDSSPSIEELCLSDWR